MNAALEPVRRLWSRLTDRDAAHIKAEIKAATARRDMRAVGNGKAALRALRHAQLRVAR